MTCVVHVLLVFGIKRIYLVSHVIYILSHVIYIIIPLDNAHCQVGNLIIHMCIDILKLDVAIIIDWFVNL